jgi:hypothetical protein
MSLLPLDARILSITRMHIQGGEHVKQFEQVWEKLRPGLVKATEPYRVVDAWRLDPEVGKQEMVVLMGWDSQNAHKSYVEKARAANPEDHTNAMSHYVEMDLRYTKNMERQ